MNMEMLPVYIIMALVLIGLPILLGRLSGKSPMEVFFGDRINNTIFGRKKSKGSGASSADTGENNPAKGKGSNPPAKNSTKQELLSFVSDLVSYSRRNHFYSIVPGTLSINGETASFACIIVTRQTVLGFNCFGYGGLIFCENGKDTWRQLMNGQETRFDSPAIKNQKQEEILRQVLTACGYPDLRTQVYGVFPAPSASLQHRSGTDCYSHKNMLQLLQNDTYLKDKGVDPQKVGKALEKYVKKA